MKYIAYMLMNFLSALLHFRNTSLFAHNCTSIISVYRLFIKR